MDQIEKGEGQITLPKLGRSGADKSRCIDIRRKMSILTTRKEIIRSGETEYRDLTPIFKLVEETLPQK